ncbi:MAG TPA: CFI-box-CTERM domain-containing protein [Nitrosopumilaceae archaeon]|nr:CFI-box-CTERM domain-containing protein [Nitrosopumilaceae archaeon]
MNFKLLIPSLLILVFAPAFGALSDATGLVNRFDIEAGGHVFEITITANFDVREIEFDKEQKQLTLYIISNLENNLGEIIIPQNLLSGNFTFYLNDQQYMPKINSNSKISFITLNFTGSGNNKIDVIGTNYLEELDKVDDSGQDILSEDKKSPSEDGGCLIATATFDSELSTQVQQLRELRDHKLLQTKSGSEFMENFNSFYYSFSPQIADMERENPLLKETIKIGITPLLLSLSLLNNVEMNSEFEVVGYGFSIILLNLGMYFAAPTLIVARLGRR